MLSAEKLFDDDEVVMALRYPGKESLLLREGAAPVTSNASRATATRTATASSARAPNIWSMNAPEFYTLLVAERGWSPDRFAAWLAEAWERLVLVD